MDEKQLRRLLNQVRSGRSTVASATALLKDLPFAALDYATVDTHRALRVGFPEVIFGGPKSLEQCVGIARALTARRQSVLLTRIDADKASGLSKEFSSGTYFEAARVFWIPSRSRIKSGNVAVVCAGTSDIPVAEEAAVTAECLGATVTRIRDVGVAGIHRLLKRQRELNSVHAVVAVAGMEGALASAVGGLVGVPVIAVPTSIGYGAHYRGLTALLSMMNSCASNVSVVNIDNGFGAGYQAALISRTRGRT